MNRKNTNDAKTENWHGIEPHLLLIHCLVEDDDIRKAYQLSMKVMTKAEVDGQYNTHTMRPDPWMLISQKWKDPEFNPKSEAFPDLHVDFKDPIDLSYSIVKKMVITPDKAKDKFYRLKNDLIAVKAKWELSGMGLNDPRVCGNDVAPRNLQNDIA